MSGKFVDNFVLFGPDTPLEDIEKYVEMAMNNFSLFFIFASSDALMQYLGEPSNSNIMFFVVIFKESIRIEEGLESTVFAKELSAAKETFLRKMFNETKKKMLEDMVGSSPDSVEILKIDQDYLKFITLHASDELHLLLPFKLSGFQSWSDGPDFNDFIADICKYLL